VDPGSYQIIAKSPGKKPWKKTVEVPPGASIVSVEVPQLEAQEPEVVSPAASKPEQKPAPPASNDRPPSADRGEHRPTLAVLGLAGLGVGGVVFGSIMAGRYSVANSNAKAVCPSSLNCTSEQITFHDRRVQDARGDRTLAVVGFGVGGLGLAAAAALLFLPQAKPESAWLATPVVARDGSVGANLSGSF
jgi:hypothetical protein